MSKSSSRQKANVFMQAFPDNKKSGLLTLVLVCFFSEDYLLYSVLREKTIFSLSSSEAFLQVVFPSLLASVCACMVFLWLQRSRAIAFDARRGLPVICAVMMLCPVVWFLTPDTQMGLLADVSALCIFAAGHVIFVPEIVKKLSVVGFLPTFVYFASAQIVLALLVVIASVLPDDFILGLLLFVPLVMLSCLRRVDFGASKEQKKKASDQGQKEKLPRVLFMTLLCMGLLFEFIDGVVVPELPDTHQVAHMLSFFVSAAIIVILAWRVRLDFNKLFYVVCLPLMVLGLILFSLEIASLMGVSVVVFLVGRTLSNAVLFALFTYLVRYSSLNYYLITLTASLGLFLGRLVCALLFEGMGGALGLESHFASAVSLLAFCVLWISLVFYGENNMKSGWGSFTPNDMTFGSNAAERSCEAVGNRAGLTPRELDVLKLLSKGYTRVKISEELFISEGTTKTHVKHVYQKLHVRSQQELIDLVEENQQAV